MSYNFLNSGDVFAVGHDGETYVGRIDSEGNWCPESEDYVDLEKFLRFTLRRELVCWANGWNPNWEPDSSHLTFAGFENTDDDWDTETRDWKPELFSRILSAATDDEKYDAGLLGL